MVLEPEINQDKIRSINKGLRAQKAGVTIQLRGKALNLRALLPSKDGGIENKQQRVLIGEKANSIGLKRTYQLALQLAAEKKAGMFVWKNWIKSQKEENKIRVKASNKAKDWVVKFEHHFWKGRINSAASQRTWQRVKAELNRIDLNKILSIDELVRIGEGLEPGSKRRHEFCKVAKRLAVFAELTETSKIDEIRTPYQPKTREFPDEEQLLELVQSLRDDPKWGWCTAALYIYGCRPSEVFSLQPKNDGTAKVLTIKQQKKIPSWRTALALPQELVEPLNLYEISKPLDYKIPKEYNSLEAKSWTDRWNKWLKKNCGHQSLQLYDIRHAWAIRSIRMNLSTAAGAKSMGHEVNVHVKTYMSALSEADMAAVAASLRK